MTPQTCQIAVIGAGPSGLATATRLRELGARDVVLIERESEAGGIPRHCGHSPFGLREFYCPMSGPAYARRLARKAARRGVQIRLKTSVVRFEEDGLIILSTPAGEQQLQASRIVICTGNREAPRSARLVSGVRPMGVLTTGALQSMVYLKKRLPFKRPVIVGSELVSFSALLTCRHAGIRPAAMIEADDRVTAMAAAAWLPRLLGIPLLLNHSLQSIEGGQRVESVTLQSNTGEPKSIDCDGVVFTGNFVAEASLVRSSHLQFDPRSGGPMVDQYGRCSDPRFYAAGNLLHPVDTAGWCWAEGRRLAHYIRADLLGDLPATQRLVDIDADNEAIGYVTPQRIALPDDVDDLLDFSVRFPGLQLRFKRACRGRIHLANDVRRVSSRRLNAREATRQLLDLPIDAMIGSDKIILEISEEH